jgi:hypothetical protein
MNRLSAVGPVLIAGFMLMGSIVGCGGDGTPDELSGGSPDPALVGAVAPARSHVDYVDVSRAREQLGLAADEDLDPPANTDEALSGEQLVLATIASHLSLYAPRPRPGPVAKAIDGTRVTEGATAMTVSPDAVAALRTTQPFDELAASLEEHGYLRRGEILVSGSTELIQPFFPAVAEGDGLIILGGSAQAVDRALSDPDVKPGDAASFLDDVGGVARQVDVATPRRGCVTSVAIGQDLDPAVGEILVNVTDEASAEAFVLDAGPDPEDPDKVVAPPGVDFHAVDADGRAVRATFTYSLEGYEGGTVGLFSLAFSNREIYRC